MNEDIERKLNQKTHSSFIQKTGLLLEQRNTVRISFVMQHALILSVCIYINKERTRIVSPKRR
jgi:hypothetical protein